MCELCTVAICDSGFLEERALTPIPSSLASFISEASLKRYRTPQPTTVDTVPQVPEDALAPLYHIWTSGTVWTDFGWDCPHPPPSWRCAESTQRTLWIPCPTPWDRDPGQVCDPCQVERPAISRFLSCDGSCRRTWREREWRAFPDCSESIDRWVFVQQRDYCIRNGQPNELIFSKAKFGPKNK